MTQSLQFRYYYGEQSEQFHFYRIPKVLFTDARFKNVSAEAKILYGLMLDRMSLSRKNNWVDKENRIYIYFTLEDALELLGCGHGKAVKLFSELDSVKGIGLIERKKQGQGKPAKIYVKNFVSPQEMQTSENRNSEKKTIIKTSSNPNTVPKTAAQTSENQNSEEKRKKQTSNFEKSANLQIGSQDFPKANANNTDINKTEYSDTELSYPSKDAMDEMERVREIAMVGDKIRENIEYDILLMRNPSSTKEIAEMVELMTEVVSSKRSSIRLDKQEIPQKIVKDRLLSLQCEHIEYVLESMKNSSSQIHNIRAYLLTALYHAPETIHNYYAAGLRE